MDHTLTPDISVCNLIQFSSIQRFLSKCQEFKDWDFLLSGSVCVTEMSRMTLFQFSLSATRSRMSAVPLSLDSLSGWRSCSLMPYKLSQLSYKLSQLLRCLWTHYLDDGAAHWCPTCLPRCTDFSDTITGLWLVERDHLTWNMASDWLSRITWPTYWLLIDQGLLFADNPWILGILLERILCIHTGMMNMAWSDDK